MDVELTIRYSDERPCIVTVARPDSGDILYRIVSGQMAMLSMWNEHIIASSQTEMVPPPVVCCPAS
jgi:hypothetical protein